MNNILRRQLLYIDKIIIVIVLIKAIESGTISEDMNTLAWTNSSTNASRTRQLENSHLDRRKLSKASHITKENGQPHSRNDTLGGDKTGEISERITDIAIPRVKYLNTTESQSNRQVDSKTVKNHVNSSDLFENIMHHVRRKNTTYSNLYNSTKHSNKSSNSSDLSLSIGKQRRDTIRVRVPSVKSKTVIRSSDHKRLRQEDIEKIHQVQSDLNNDYLVKDEGGEVGRNEEVINYDSNGDVQNTEDDKLYNHKLDRSLFDRTSHMYNPNNPIHSINQLYTSFQSQDMSDYPNYATPRNRNIEQNPMVPYFESSSMLPTFTTARSYHDINALRRFPQAYYYLRPTTTTTTTESPDYEYFEEEIQEIPSFEAKKRWSQPLSPYSYRPISKLSSGYGYSGYGGPEYSHTGYGSSGPSYHGPPDYGHSSHGHHHIPIITETIIHKQPPKHDFKKLAILALFKFGFSKLKWFFLLKLVLFKLLKLKFILFLVFLKIFLFFKFLKFLKFLKLLLIPLLLLPLLPVLLLAGLLLFLPVPVLAPATGTTSTFFTQGRRRRRRRELTPYAEERQAKLYVEDYNLLYIMAPEDAMLLAHRVVAAERYLEELMCDGHASKGESNIAYRWLSKLSRYVGLNKSKLCDKI